VLSSPYGANLPSLLFTKKELRESVSAFFKSKGFRLELRPQSHEILMSKEVGDVLYSFPFESISETMRRIVFYKAALESNKDAVLVLDEPEANTFPFYTKYLAERIALDETNQFFLSTHNPYVLMSIIEKTPSPDLAVYATRMQNFRTEVQLLSDQQCAEALELGMDLFLNIDRLFPE
jgi:AAA15 family ATPase/GTPase